MPYTFEANAVFLSYLGITIYHVYRNNYSDGGVREYWYTTEEYGCEDDDDAFDVRDKPGFDSSISIAANMVNMIRNGEFGPVTEDHDQYINEDDSKEGHCPVCQSTDLEFDSYEVEGESIEYPFTCSNCGIAAKEYGNIVFNGYWVD